MNICEMQKKLKDAAGVLEHGGGKVMVWGCFGGAKVENLYMIKRDLEQGR